MLTRRWTYGMLAITHWLSLKLGVLFSGPAVILSLAYNYICFVMFCFIFTLIQKSQIADLYYSQFRDGTTDARRIVVYF